MSQSSTSSVVPVVAIQPPLNSPEVKAGKDSKPDDAQDDKKPKAQDDKKLDPLPIHNEPPKTPLIVSGPNYNSPSNRITAAKVSEPLREQVGNSRYLGDPNLMDKVEWFQEGLKSTAVEIDPEVLQFDPAEDAHPRKTTARFSMIAKMSGDRFFFRAQGDYYGPNSKFANKGLKGAKATALLHLPDISDLGTLWDAYKTNAALLQDSAPQVFATRKGWYEMFEPGTEGYHKEGTFRVTHPLFEEVPVGQDRFVSQGLKKTMATWPVPENCQEQLEALINSKRWIVNPIPAYDMRFSLIDATAYERQLRGSIVEIHFTLEHWRFPNGKGGGESRFVANVLEIIVHRLPVRIYSPLTKRGAPNAMATLGSGSPQKRIRSE